MNIYKVRIEYKQMLPTFRRNVKKIMSKRKEGRSLV